MASKTQGAATGGVQLSATANQFVDKIVPFSKRGTSRRRRIVNSSRYHPENEPELTQLALIKDTPPAEQTALVVQELNQLNQCQRIFDFYDPVAQLKSKEMAALNELIDEITNAKESDIDEILHFLTQDFLYNEPLNRSLRLPWHEASFFMREITQASVSSGHSAIIRNDAGEIIAIGLNSVKSVKSVENEAAPSNEKTPGQMDYIANFLWQLDRKLAENLPKDVDTVMKVEIMSVSSAWTRRGLAGKLMDFTIERQKRLKIPIFTECSALASQKLFAKYNFTLLFEICHVNYLDLNGRRIFNCDDGTDRGQLVLKMP
ncbi:unnamed protein product, partial [Mesorhabditis belari]|uniref:aralkylamine N-acetyltransferase n=1 Tax=Mesorhabditis belari TaxID=2138241 RepID=A0AAF3EP07_9BILA